MISGIDFFNLPAEKYWEYTKGYDQNKKKHEIKNHIMSGDYIGAIKKDGHYMRFVKDENGEMSWQGRSESVNGGYINKIDKVPQFNSFFDRLPNGTVLLGEAYFPDNPGSKNVTTILGCLTPKALERQKTNPLHYYIFDIWAYNGQSLLDIAATDRIKMLKQLTIHLEGTISAPYVEIARYKRGSELWELLQWARENDEEGIVITKATSHAEPGKRTARKTLKIKKELDTPIDAFLTGNYKMANRIYEGKNIEDWLFWESNLTHAKMKGKYYEKYVNGADIVPVKANYFNGVPGSLEIGLYKESTQEIIPIGWISGVSDEVKIAIANRDESYINKPCLVSAMELDNESGCLRHGKILQFRDDITWKDCTWEKVYGDK